MTLLLYYRVKLMLLVSDVCGAVAQRVNDYGGKLARQAQGIVDREKEKQDAFRN